MKKKIITFITLCLLTSTLGTSTSTLAYTGALGSNEKKSVQSEKSMYSGSDTRDGVIQYDEGGVKIFAICAEETEDKWADFEYINELTGDTGVNTMSRGMLYAPGMTEYHWDSSDDGDAYAYAWKRNTISEDHKNVFEGGQTISWFGDVDADYIIFNQSIQVRGINVSVSWPPAMSGDGKSGSWQSQPIHSNTAAASFSNLVVSNSATSVTFSESADVYVGNRIYRPMTYIKFSYFS